MDEGLLSLKWNNHKTTFFEILRLLRDKANYTDATLAVDGKFYPVHKLVLSTCSEYFSEIFERTPCKSPVIVLKDVRSQDLESLLDYMYLGEVNVNQNDLALLLKTAECLRIKGLAVPDDDLITRHSTTTRKFASQENLSDAHAPPPPKRRKEDTTAPLSIPSPNRTSPSCRVPTSPNLLATQKQCISDQNSPENRAEIPAVKLEIEEKDNDDDDEETYASETNYDSNNENEIKDFNVEKSEFESPRFSNTNYPVTSSQSGDISWEDGENSFPPDSYGGDASNQQGGGEEEDEEVDVTSYNEDGSSSFLPLSLSLTQSREARRCQLCQVTLANANLLRRHVEDHHFHIRKYDCVHCGKKFKRKEHRERHERIHTGEKPFACHICLSRFTQKEHLKGHVENVHNKHLKERDPKDSNYSDIKCDQEERDNSTSSPPSLASPSSLASLMSSPLASMLPSTTPLSSLASHQFPTWNFPPSTLPSSSEDGITAIYAPVNRKTVNSPNKHVQTITINFN